MDAAINTKPLFVTKDPPILGEPQCEKERMGPFLTEPNGICHFNLPVFKSIATNLPHGGAVQGTPSGEINGLRIKA